MKDSKKLGVGRQIIGGLEADPGFVPKMQDAIMKGLEAEVRVFSKGDPEAKTVPDYRARLEAFKLAMAYAEGLPLQRIIQANITNNSFADMDSIKQAVASSPAMLSGLRRMLDEIEPTKKPDPKRIELEPKK